jgi:hypothetical protein
VRTVANIGAAMQPYVHRRGNHTGLLSTLSSNCFC